MPPYSGKILSLTYMLTGWISPPLPLELKSTATTVDCNTFSWDFFLEAQCLLLLPFQLHSFQLILKKGKTFSRCLSAMTWAARAYTLLSHHRSKERPTVWPLGLMDVGDFLSFLSFQHWHLCLLEFRNYRPAGWTLNSVCLFFRQLIIWSQFPISKLSFHYFHSNQIHLLSISVCYLSVKCFSLLSPFLSPTLLPRPSLSWFLYKYWYSFPSCSTSWKLLFFFFPVKIMWNLVDYFIPYISSQMCTSNPDLFLELQIVYSTAFLTFPLRWQNGHLSLNISKTELLIFFQKLLYLMTTHPSTYSGEKAGNYSLHFPLTPISNATPTVSASHGLHL